MDPAHESEIFPMEKEEELKKRGPWDEQVVIGRKTRDQGPLSSKGS